MCVPDGLLAITTAIVLYAITSSDKESTNILCPQCSLFSNAMNHLINVNLNLFFFSTSFKTDFQFQEVNTFSPCSLLNFLVRQLRVRLLVSYAVQTETGTWFTINVEKTFQ